MKTHRRYTANARIMVYHDGHAEILLADGTEVIGDGSGRQFTEQEAIAIVDEIERRCWLKEAERN